MVKAGKSPKTVANAHGFLSAVLSEFRPDVKLTTRLPQKEKHEIQIPTKAEVQAIAETCRETIFLPTVRAMAAEGRPFRGCLYFGLMLTPDGPKVIEYNCRFGDPETQVVLPLLESDLLTVMQACTAGTLAETEVRFSPRSACCVVLASNGYPGKYETGFPLTMTPEAAAHTYIAGAKEKEGVLVTAGGRVAGVTAVADTLPEALLNVLNNSQYLNRSLFLQAFQYQS